LAVRTVTESVERVGGPPANAAALESRLAALRERFPGAVFDRYLSAAPVVGEEVHIAPTACLVGDVRLGREVSVWYGVVLRGDVSRIEIGARSNLQDGTVVHLGDADPTLVGQDVVVGHRAVLHGCTIGDACLIGIQATVLDGAVIGAGSVIGACALVTAGTVIPPRSLVLGAPGKVVKTLDDPAAFARALAAKYCRLQHNHRIG
jgi:carbonic anhydrase/acetyltransferase-like protein (isoleucine patch superfamily)